jgi:hypothetical protein
VHEAAVRASLQGMELGSLVYCDDVPAFRSALLAAGVEAGPISQPFYNPRGEFRVTDPDGYVLMITHTRRTAAVARGRPSASWTRPST